MTLHATSFVSINPPIHQIAQITLRHESPQLSSKFINLSCVADCRYMCMYVFFGANLFTSLNCFAHTLSISLQRYRNQLRCGVDIHTRKKNGYFHLDDGKLLPWPINKRTKLGTKKSQIYFEMFGSRVYLANISLHHYTLT